MDGGRRPAQRPTSLNLPAFAAWKHSLSVSLDSEEDRRPRWPSENASTDQSPNMDSFSTKSKGSEVNDRPSWSNSWSVISNNRRQSTGLAERKSPLLFSPTMRRGSASAGSTDRPVWTSNWNAANKNRGQSTDLIDSSNTSFRRQPKTSPKAELLSPTSRRGSVSVEANDRPRWTSTWGVTTMNRRQSADILDDYSLPSRRMSDATAKADLFSPTRRRGSATVDVSDRPSWTSTWSVTSMKRRQSADLLDDYSPSSRRMSDATAKADLFSPTRRRGSATVDVSDRPSWTSTWSVTSMKRRQSADLLDDYSPSSRRMSDATAKADLFSPTRRRGSATVDVSDRPSWTSTWSVTSMKRRQSADLLDDYSPSSRRMSDATAKADLFSPTRRRGSATVDVSDRPSWTSTWSVTSMKRRQSADLLDDYSPSSRRMSDATAKADLFSPTRRRGSATVDSGDRPSWTSTWSVTSMKRRQSADLLDDYSPSSRRMSDATAKADLFSPTRRRGSATVDSGDRPSWTSTWSIVSKNRRQSADLTDGSKSDVSSRQEGFSATRRRGSESTGISERPSWTSSWSKNRRNSTEISSTPARLTDAALKLQRLSPTRVREPQGVVTGHGQTWTQTVGLRRSLTRDREGEHDQATRSESIAVHPLSTHIPDGVSSVTGDKFDGQEMPETPRERNRQEDDSDLGTHRDEQEGSEMRPRDRQPSPDSDAHDGPVESQDSMDREMRTWNGIDDVRQSETETNVGRSTTLSDHWSQQHWTSLQTSKYQIDTETDVNQRKPHQNHVVPQSDYSNHEETVVPQRELGGWMEQKTMSSKNELDKEKNLSILLVQGSESDEDRGHKIPPVISPPNPHDAMFHESLVPVIPIMEPEDTWNRETLVAKQTPLEEGQVLRPSELDENCEHKFSAITQKEQFQEFVNENQMVPESESQEITLNEIDDDHEIPVNPLNKHDHDSWYEISVVDDIRNENQIELDEDQNPGITTYPRTESDKDLNQEEVVMELVEVDEKSTNEISITSLTEFDEMESLMNSEVQRNATDEEKSHEIPTVDTRTESCETMINKNAAHVIPIAEPDDTWTQETPTFQQTQLHDHQERESTVLQQPELDENWMPNVSAIAQEELFQDLLNEYRMVPERKIQEITLNPLNEVDENHDHEILVNTLNEHNSDSYYEIPILEDTSNEEQIELDKYQNPDSKFPRTESDDDLDQEDLVLQRHGKKSANNISIKPMTEFDEAKSLGNSLVQENVTDEERGQKIVIGNAQKESQVARLNEDLVLVIPTTEPDDAWNQEIPSFQKSELHKDWTMLPQSESDQSHEFPVIPQKELGQDFVSENTMDLQSQSQEIALIPRTEVDIDSNLETLTSQPEYNEKSELEVPMVYEPQVELEECHSTIPQREADEDRMIINLVDSHIELDEIKSHDDTLTVQNNVIQNDCINEILTISKIESENKDNMNKNLVLASLLSEEDGINSKGNTLVQQVQQSELHDDCSHEFQATPQTEPDRKHAYPILLSSSSEQQEIQQTEVSNCDIRTVEQNEMVKEWKDEENRDYTIYVVSQNGLEGERAHETTKVLQNESDKDRTHKNLELVIPETDLDQNPELNEYNITTFTELLEYRSNETPAFPQTELLDYRLNEIPIYPETELPKNLINKNSVVQTSEFNKDWSRDIQISPQIKLDDIVNVNQVVLQTDLGEDNSYNITTVIQNKLHESISHESLVLPQTEPDKNKSHRNMEMLTCQTEQDECTVNDNLTIPRYLVNCDMHHQNLMVPQGESYYTSKKETPNELVENLSHQNFMVQQIEDEAIKNSRIQMLENKLVDMTIETERLQALSKQLTSELHEVRGELARTEQALLTIKMELSETNERHQKMTDELSFELNAKSNILEATFREIKLILTERRRNKEWVEGNITDERSAREIVGQVKEIYLSLEKENKTLTTTVNELEDELSWEDRASVQASMETLQQNLRNTKHKIEVIQEEQARKNQIIECLKEEQRMERESYDFKLQHLQEENTTLHEKLADVKEKLYKAECTLMENKQLKPKINSDTYSMEEKNGETRDNNQTCSSEDVKINISKYNTGTDILSTLEMLQKEKDELSQRLEESREEADNLLKCQRERHEAALEELLEEKQNEVNELKVQTDAQVLKLTTEKQTLEELLVASQKEREKLQDIIIKLDQAQTQLQESVIQAIDKSVTPTKKEMEIYYNFNHSTESTIETDDTHCLQTETSANEYEPIFKFTETQVMKTIHDDKMKSDQQDTNNKITKDWELTEAIETNGMAQTQRVDNTTNVCQDTIYTVKGNKDDRKKHVTFLIPGTKEGQTTTQNEQITFSRQGGRLLHNNVDMTGAHFVLSEDSEALIETLSSEKRELEQQLTLTRMTLSTMDQQFRELQESESKLWREREASVQVVHKLLEKVELQQQSLEQHGGCEGAFYREKAESLSAYVQQLQAELNNLRREATDPN